MAFNSEELKKVQEIIDAKNELLLQVYLDEISSEYYNKALKQLIKLLREYVANLQHDEKKLIDEIFQIKEAIEQITEEMLDIPQSKEEAINYVEEEMQKDQFLRQIDSDISKIETFIDCMAQILSYDKNYGENYYDIYEQIKIDRQDYARTLELDIALTKKWQLDKLSKKLQKIQDEFERKFDSLPKNYCDYVTLMNKKNKMKDIGSIKFCRLTDGRWIDRSLCLVMEEACYTKPGVACSQYVLPSRLARIESNKPAIQVLERKKGVVLLDFGSYIKGHIMSFFVYTFLGDNCEKNTLAFNFIMFSYISKCI